MTMQGQEMNGWTVPDLRGQPSDADIPKNGAKPLLGLLAAIAIFIAIMGAMLVEMTPG